jgi:hypothetical protein
MNTSNYSLEDKVFYRAVKAVYLLIIFLCTLALICMDNSSDTYASYFIGVGFFTLVYYMLLYIAYGSVSFQGTIRIIKKIYRACEPL